MIYDKELKHFKVRLEVKLGCWAMTLVLSLLAPEHLILNKTHIIVTGEHWNIHPNINKLA